MTVSSADMVAQISSCSIFEGIQSRLFEEPWCSSPTIFKTRARTSSTSEIRTFLPISAKPRVKYVEVSFLIDLPGARSSAWLMRPVLPSCKSVSDTWGVVEGSHLQRAQRRTQRFSSMLRFAVDMPSQMIHTATSSVIGLVNYWCISEPRRSLIMPVSAGPGDERWHTYSASRDQLHEG